LGISGFYGASREGCLRGWGIPGRRKELDMDLGNQRQGRDLSLESKVRRVVHELNNWEIEIMRRGKDVGFQNVNKAANMGVNRTNSQRTIGGTVSTSAAALAIKSSKPSRRESVRVAWISISTGRPRLSAHRRPSTASGESFLKIVDKEVGTLEDEMRVSIAGSGFSNSKGTIKEIIWDSLELPLNLRDVIQIEVEL
jgi:hypothetical protein